VALSAVVAAAIMALLFVIRSSLREMSPVRTAMHVFVRRAGGHPLRLAQGGDIFNHRKIQERRFEVRVRDVAIEIWAEIGGEALNTILKMKAPVAVPPGPTFHMTTSGDSAPPAEIAAAWREAAGKVGHLYVQCDGNAVGAIVQYPLDADGIAAVADLVAAIARIDGGLGETLLALPGATPLTGHALVPGVVLDADGLVIGVRERSRVVAQLDDVRHEGELPASTRELVARAGDGELLATAEGARFTWRGIERDPARLRAGVDALRSLRGATGPYR
jgi:hypothetical protein